MRTTVTSIDPLAPDPEAIRGSASIIRAGGLVAFPTETVYGLGANALDAAAVARIFEAKGRPAHNPLIVHVHDAEAAGTVVALWTETAALLAARFWPGPLTLVLARSPHVPDIVTAGGTTVAVRVPAHPVALALIRAAGVPIAAPSANRSTRVSPTCAEHVLRTLDGRIDMVLDGGPTSGGIESTVLDISSDQPRILRPGLVGPAEIEAVLGVPVARPHRPKRVSATGPHRSPGLSTRHYAPRTPSECAPAPDASARVAEILSGGERVVWLAMGDVSPHPRHDRLSIIPMPSDPAAYAARLYSAFHEADDHEPDRIVITWPPDTEEWLAVRDRLHRATALRG